MFDLETQKKIFKGYCKGFPISENNPFGKKGDGSKTYKYNTVKDLHSYGAVCKKGYVDISFDNLNTDSRKLSEVLIKILDYYEIETYMLLSDNGIHTYWKLPANMELKGGIKILACGIPADIHHKNTYIPLKCDGKERKEYWKDGFDVIPELPVFLYPVKNTQGSSDRGLWDLKEGEARNVALSSFVFSCISYGIKKESIIDIFNNITNKFVFADSLLQSEMDTILRDETFEKTQEDLFYDGKTFKHDVMAKYITDNNNVIILNDRLHMFNGKYYESSRNDKQIEKLCIELVENLKRNQRAEVVSYIELYARDVEMRNEYCNYITFANGVYSIKEDRIVDFSPDVIDVAQIPWCYNINAYDKTVDKVLNNLTCNKPDVRALLEEAVGYCFYRRNELAAAFFLDGEGSNGKSTFYKMLGCMLGKKNVSDLDITQVGNKFMTINLYEKLANIGDDVTKCYLSPAELATLKKAITGDAMTVDVKNKTSVTFTNYAKMFFACNGMPNLTNDPAVLRRLKVIPFKARFVRGQSDYDDTITDKLTTQSAMEYLVKLGIEGLKRLLKNKDFTECEDVNRALHEYVVDTDSGVAFIEDFGVDNIIGKTPNIMIGKYEQFCREAGYKYPKSWKTVATLLKKNYNIIGKNTRIDGMVVKIYTRMEGE